MRTAARWYVRQLTGAANIDGGPVFHVISGNLGYQVEHHLFPDMPSTRYGEIAPEVREICQRYGLPYNSGPFHQQLGMVQRTILRLAFPGGKHRPKPGAYDGPLVRGKGETASVPAEGSGSRFGSTSLGEFRLAPVREPRASSRIRLAHGPHGCREAAHTPPGASGPSHSVHLAACERQPRALSWMWLSLKLTRRSLCRGNGIF